MRTPGWLPGSTVLIYASCLAHHTYAPRQAPASLLAGGEGLSGKQANFSPDDTPLAASPVQTSPVKLEVQSVPHPQPAAERCCLFILVGPAALACLCLPPRTLSRASVAPPVSPWKAHSPEASPRPAGVLRALRAQRGSLWEPRPQSPSKLTQTLPFGDLGI